MTGSRTDLSDLVAGIGTIAGWHPSVIPFENLRLSIEQRNWASLKYFVSFSTVSLEMSNQNFVCESGSHGVGCGPPSCICIQLGQNYKEIDCSYIGEIYKTTHDSPREASEIEEFVDKVKQNIDSAIFTINMAEKPLSEVADFLEMLVPEVKVPESVQSKSVALQVEKRTMKEIISDLGLKMSKTQANNDETS